MLGKEKINEMDYNELVKIVREKQDELDLETLQYILDRADSLSGREKTQLDIISDYVNGDAFDDLPIEEQLKKLMEYSSELIKEGRELADTIDNNK